MRTFIVLCIAQSISLAGTILTGFGLGVWLLKRTGSTTLYGWMALATLIPPLLASPLAGALVDRWSPRRALLAGQVGAGLCTLALVALVRLELLGVGAILVLTALASVFSAVNFPGLSAATTVLVHKDSLGRANGASQIGLALAQLAAPALAGTLMSAHGLGSLMVIDAASYLFAIVALIVLDIPQTSSADKPARPSLGGEIRAGWQYIRERPGFHRLLALAAIGNFIIAVVHVVIAPLLLGFADERVLGVVASVSGSGTLVGGVLFMVWGGPRNHVRGVVLFVLLQCTLLFLGAARTSAVLVGVGGFGIFFAVPIVVGCAQVIWQRKVPLEIQGRVFALRAVLAQSVRPLAYLISGPLVDRVFEPAMAPGGSLAATAGAVLGVGPGRGVALMLVLLGVLTTSAVLLCAASPRLRRIEEELPDQAVPR